MTKPICATVGVAALLLAFAVVGSSAQESAGPPDVTPAPRPELPQQYYPRFTYGPLEAAEEARRRAEEAGRDAVNRQLDLADDIRWMNTWAPTTYRDSLPYIYGYGGPRVGRRVERAFERWVDPVFTPWPRVPGDIYGYPYYAPAKQPIGHEKIWTSPNSYVYRPKYAPSSPQPARPTAPAPTPARCPPPPAAPPNATMPVEPEVLPPGAAEPIPLPSPLPRGPREF
jgi:hypothetical protein